MPTRSAKLVCWTAACFILAAGTGSCRNRPDVPEAAQEEEAALQPTIEEAQKDLTPTVMAVPGVVGIAIGECEGEPCIKVLAARRTPQMEEKIPAAYKGYKVVIDETGEITAPPPPRASH